MKPVLSFSGAGNGLEKYRDILGKTVIDQLESIDPKYAPLVIGDAVFSKHFLVTVIRVGNFHACRNVTRACKELDIATLDEFLNTPPEQFAALKDFGELSCLVVLRVREWKKRGTGWKSDVTFRSQKLRELREAAEETRTARNRRKSARARILSHRASELAAAG